MCQLITFVLHDLLLVSSVNRCYVYAMRSLGQGFSGAKKFCCTMNIPNRPSKHKYTNVVKALKTAAFNVAKDNMKRAADELKCNANDECAVSVDGSWQTHGYTSLNGYNCHFY